MKCFTRQPLEEAHQDLPQHLVFQASGRLDGYMHDPGRPGPVQVGSVGFGALEFRAFDLAGCT